MTDNNRIEGGLSPLTVNGLAPIHSEIRLRIAEGWSEGDIIARLKRLFRLNRLEAAREITDVKNQRARTIHEPEAKVIQITRGTK